ncbi:hypothetical protein ACSE3M_01205 [Bacillus velezensis]
MNSCYMSLGEEELQLKKRIHVPLMIERLTLYGPVMSDTVYVVNTIKHKKTGFSHLMPQSSVIPGNSWRN